MNDQVIFENSLHRRDGTMRNRMRTRTATITTISVACIMASTSLVNGYSSTRMSTNTNTFSNMRSSSPLVQSMMMVRDQTSHYNRFRRGGTPLLTPMPPMRMSATNEEIETEPVFEDVDGIGELTSTITGITATATSTGTTTTTTAGTDSSDSFVLPVENSNSETQNIIEKFPAVDLDPSTPVVGQAVSVPGPVLVPEAALQAPDILDISKETTQAQAAQFLDPLVVVEGIISTALSDPDANGVIPTNSLLEDTATTTKEQRVQLMEDDEVVEAPSISKIIKFAIPAVGVWLCNPLLSLIDTSSVGLLSGTAQQAALNPAVAVTDYSALLIAFMYTATTNLVAGARESEKHEVDKPKTSAALINALQLSGFVGLAIGTTLATLAPVLLRAIIGNDLIDPEVFSAALMYVRIRAIGMPAAAIIGSAQSACLGLQDIKSPMYVLVAAALVNLMGDLIFVGRSSAWIGGAAGAAWATVFSQYAALALFLKWLVSKPKPKRINVTQGILELTGKSSEGKSRRARFRKALHKLSMQISSSSKNEKMTTDVEEIQTTATTSTTTSNPLSKIFKRFPKKATPAADEKFSTRGFLANKLKKRQLLQFPPIEEAKKFMPYLAPVTTTSIGRVSAFVAMSHVVSSSLGTLSMAANQVVLSVFYCLCPFADSLNLTAQSFIPGIFQKKHGRARSAALQESMLNFAKAGVMFGAASAFLVGLIPMICKYFTSDPLVITQVTSVLPILASIFSLHGLICAGEGLLLGQKDLGFLGKAYSVYFFAVPFLMLRLKRMALTGVKAVSLSSLWEIFLSYQIVRCSVWALRLRLLNKRARVEGTQKPEQVLVPGAVPVKA